MRTVPYESNDKTSGNTETHIATDTAMDENNYDSQRMEEGFAASDGVRGGTAESGGRVKQPESSDAPLIDRTPKTIAEENPGLAD